VAGLSCLEASRCKVVPSPQTVTGIWVVGPMPNCNYTCCTQLGQLQLPIHPIMAYPLGASKRATVPVGIDMPCSCSACCSQVALLHYRAATPARQVGASRLLLLPGLLPLLLLARPCRRILHLCAGHRAIHTNLHGPF
jgi:hypothetical protein